ncbi:hypothetical protein [Flavobacterium chilense]|uniref:Uncharacterized protein n=1 Tax=Flavobacterium chilense TaxID=946677 RepID=A0A1M7IQD1_9FLAO|nr:hypothetical protein [Flavobacterium chilense]SHM42889.1 hypothetical protein SAMN05444484_1066 [Flavobacterium chilense]
MKKILEDTNTFLGSIIGIIGGFIWAMKNNWDYEPIILLSVSTVALICFLAIKFFGENTRPNVEAELKRTGSNRGPQMMVPGLSPQNAEGHYLPQENGIFHYDFEYKYNLIIRNNSTQNAYNVKVYVEKNYSLKFLNETNLLDSLTVDKSKIIKAEYNFGRNFSSQESLNELSNHFNDEIRKTKFVIEYQDEQRKTYFTEFFPPNTNIHAKKKPKMGSQEFRQI